MNNISQNSIVEEIKSRLRSGNACYHSVQNILSSRLLSKNVKIKIYRTIILPAVLYGCETWSLTLREEKKLRVFENMVLLTDLLNYLLPYLLTPWNSPSWEANRFSASQEIPRILWNRRFITAITSAHHLSISWARLLTSIPHPTSSISFLILSSHLRLGLPSGPLFHSLGRTKGSVQSRGACILS